MMQIIESIVNLYSLKMSLQRSNQGFLHGFLLFSVLVFVSDTRQFMITKVTTLCSKIRTNLFKYKQHLLGGDTQKPIL